MRQRRAGLTLVEVLVVLAIIGLVGSVVALNAGIARPSLDAEAERFARAARRAQELAVIHQRQIALRVDAQGYSFQQWRDGAWRALGGRDWAPIAWSSPLIVETGGEDVIFFDAAGLSAPKEVRLFRDGRGRAIAFDGVGGVVIAPLRSPEGAP